MDITLLHTVQVARMLKMSPEKVRRLARRGALPAHKTGTVMGKINGRDWVFNSQDVAAYLAGRPELVYPVGSTTRIRTDRPLLAFDKTDNEPLFPFGTYSVHEIEDGYWEGLLWVFGNDVAAFKGIFGTREQAIDACRADARIRIRAAKELEVAV